MKCKIFAVLMFFSFTISAQSDWRIAKNTSSLENVERIILPKQNNDLLLQEEMNRRSPGTAPHFATNIPVNINTETNGNWEYTNSGKAVWRLRILSKGAKSLNLGFSKFFMPKGGILVIYSTDRQIIAGPFSPADNEEHQQLWTPVFPADEIVIEVQLPVQHKSNLKLELTSVNHDFLGFGEIASGSCNLDVICGIDDGFPEVENHRDIIQSVAVIGLNGNTFCTGFLINNTSQDCTPYFMTADHCGITNSNAASMVAYWNYQNSTCRQPDSPASGQPGDGLLNNFNTGSIFRSAFSNSDFTLVELDDPLDESAQAFLAGWDRGTDAPSSTIAVHHPNTEEKRISFENDPSMMTNGFGNSPSASFTHVRVVDWDLGTTEPGSSGSPLFDQNERVVGQLHGGGAACGNNQSDWYGAISRSWTGGGTSSSRLSNWLDPNETGIVELDGIPASFCTFAINAVDENIKICTDGEATFELISSINFTDTIQLEVIGLPPNVEYSLSNNPINPGDTTYLTITDVSSIALDDYIFNVTATDSLNTATEMLVLSVIDVPGAPSLNLPGNGATDISTSPTYTWAPIPSASSYYFEVATDIDFTNIIKEATITTNAYNSGGLEIATTYYWRVSSINICGETVSEINSFTTLLDLAISLNASTFSICNDETVNFSLTLGSSFSSSGATLSATGLPAGASIAYSQNPATPDETISVTIADLESTPSGNYSVNITADDGSNSNSRNITLVIEAAPLPIELNSPEDSAVEVMLTPQFLWIPNDESNSYTLEIATDIGFNNIVATNTTNITVYTLPDELEASTIYYWRIIAEGDCGITPSLIRSFTTIIIDNVATLNHSQIDIRPNPTRGIINISLSAPLPGDLIVEVFSVNGQQLIQQIHTGETHFDVSLDNLPSGVYLLKMVNDQQVLSHKIVLQR